MFTRVSRLSSQAVAVGEAFASAVRAAAATNAGRAPAARDLERLGIDPAAFAAIRA